MKTVPLAAFVEAMEAKWREYGNVVSEPLRTVWAQIALAMNQQIESPSLPRPVIPAELGAGKTTAAKVYSSMLSNDGHPGVLVVVRTIEQANEYARDINAWSGAEAAIAWYSKLTPRPTLAQLAASPVLVICHKSYELALDEKMVEDDERYEKFTRFRDGARRLAIIDEALEQVYVAHIPQRMLLWIRGLVPPKILKAHKDAFVLFNSIDRALMDAPTDGNAVISSEALLAETDMSVDQADATIKSLWGAISNLVNTKYRNDVKEALTALRRHLAAYRWTESERSHTALVGSRLLLPPDAGQVFLDATGALNNVYLGRPDQFRIHQMQQVRNYQNVKLHAARVRGTGKWAMEDRGEEIARETLDAVLTHFGDRARERQVLVVTDKDSEPLVRLVWAEGGFAALDVAHWNAIDGRNDWREFDTVVALTLPWGTRTLDLAKWLAIQGIELDDEGLNTPPDGVRTVREHRIAAALAQAMGRIRLRRMVNEDGSCELCEAFIRFPHTFGVILNTDHVIDGVRRTLTGVQVVEWEAASEERTPDGRRPTQRTRLESKILATARAMKPGERRALVMKELGASSSGFYRTVENAQQASHGLYVALAEIGARVEPGGYRDGVKGKVPAALIRI